MRTTLDIDPRVLAAARSRAAHNGTSIGAEISALAMAALDASQQSASESTHNGLRVFARTGRVITDEMVRAALDED